MPPQITGQQGEQANRSTPIGETPNGDNNLERDAIKDFNEMERIGSNDHVKIVVQLDRIRGNGPEDDDSNGDWDTTKRFLVGQDDDGRKIDSQELDDLGEQNMGDPQTLVDFVPWGVKQFPAQHYALVIWDHGSSWAGIAFDDSSDKKGITLPELDLALRTAQSQTGVEGIYTVSGTGEEISAGLLFTVNRGHAELQRIYGFPKGQKQEAQPFEIAAQAGDTFTAYLRTYTIKDGRPVPDFNRGETITLGDAPLSAVQVPANSGDYVEGFLVRDLAGHVNSEYVDITIDNSGAGQYNPTPPADQPTAGPGAQTARWPTPAPRASSHWSIPTRGRCSTRARARSSSTIPPKPARRSSAWSMWP